MISIEDLSTPSFGHNAEFRIKTDLQNNLREVSGRCKISGMLAYYNEIISNLLTNPNKNINKLCLFSATASQQYYHHHLPGNLNQSQLHLQTTMDCIKWTIVVFGRLGG